MKSVVVVECAIQHNNRFLVIERPQGKHGAGLLSFPGGKVEPCDSVAAQDFLINSAKREVLEEVGIALTDSLSYITSAFFYGSNQIPIINCLFHAILDQNNPQVTPNPNEVPAYFWLTKDEILNSPIAAPWLKEYIFFL